MKREYYIDKLFREKLYSRNIPFDASGWAQVEQMLEDRSRGKYPIFRIRYFLSSVIVALLTGALWLGRGNEDVKTTETMMVENRPEDKRDLSGAVLSDEWNVKIDPYSHQEKIQGFPASPDFDKNSDNGSLQAMPTVTIRESEAATDLSEQATDAGERNLISIERGISGSVEKPVSSSEIHNYQYGANIPEEVRHGIVGEESLEASNQRLRSGLNFMAPIYEIRRDITILEVRGTEMKELESAGYKYEKNWLRGLRMVIGGGITEGGGESDETSGSGFSCFGGIMYQNALLHSLAWEAGLVISARNAFGMVYSRTDSTFDFGYVARQESYQIRQLNMMELPFLLKYRLGTRHRLGIGIQYSYIFGARYIIESNSLNSVGNIETSQKAYYGIPDGLSQHDISMIAQYEHQLTERFEMLLRIQLGGADLSSDSFYGKNRDLNHQLRIGLIFNLYK